MTRPFTASLWAACAASFVGVGLFYITLSQLGTLNGSDHQYEGTVRIWIIDTLTMFLGGGVEDMESKRTWGLKFYLLLTMTAFWIIVVLYNGQILAALTVVSVYIFNMYMLKRTPLRVKLFPKCDMKFSHFVKFMFQIYMIRISYLI